MTSLRLVLVPALTLFVTLATPVATNASCVQPPPIEAALNSAEIVFVGTVTSTANRDTWATVQVEEIWKGPDQPASVLVKGGPGANAATSIDRTFQAGVKYVFFPLVNPDAGLVPAGTLELTDNACSSTTPWSDGLAGLRPSGAHAPQAPAEGDGGFDFGGLVAPIGVALVVAAGLLGIGLLARGKQST